MMTSSNLDRRYIHAARRFNQLFDSALEVQMTRLILIAKITRFEVTIGIESLLGGLKVVQIAQKDPPLDTNLANFSCRQYRIGQGITNPRLIAGVTVDRAHLSRCSSGCASVGDVAVSVGFGQSVNIAYVGEACVHEALNLFW